MIPPSSSMGNPAGVPSVGQASRPVLLRTTLPILATNPHRTDQQFCQASTWHRPLLPVCCGIFIALVVALAMFSPPASAQAQTDPAHDFDFEFGTWHTHLRRLTKPLTNSTTWVEYDGTTKVTPVWDGRANLVELDVTGPSGHITALSLRLYNPSTNQWSLNFSNIRSGTMSTTPTIGTFKDGIGTFTDTEDFDGRPIQVRFVITPISHEEIKFEQSFSSDGGKTWELNWLATDTRSASGIACRAGCSPTTPNSTTSTIDHGPQTTETPPSLTASPPTSHVQSLDAAWWTGPLLANSAATLPHGHFLAEPYVYDVVGTQSNSNGFGSRTYLEYGLTDRLTIGAIPVFGYNEVNSGLNSSHVGIGDATALAQFGLTRWRPDSRVPSTAIMVQETFPTGKYDNLGTRPTNGLGAGAYTTTVAFNTQTYFHAPTGRLLRMRLNASEAISTTAQVTGVSVYGTAANFHGRAHPGLTTNVDWAWEYSLTRRWVLALDATYSHSANTRVTGTDATPILITLNSGTTDAVGFAPALEYNWSPKVGVIVGTRILALGHNLPTSVTPVVALNYVR
jgi:hypothetical protein